MWKSFFISCFHFSTDEISTTSIIANLITATGRPEPVLNSSCGVEFFSQEKTLIAIVSSFIIGIIFTLTVLGIAKLVQRYRKKSKSIGEYLKLIPGCNIIVN